MTPDCRPSTPPEAVEEIIARESALKGADPATHPMRNWSHCQRCRTWHRPQDFPKH